MNRIASKLPIAVRLMLGLLFFVSGLNSFLQLAPFPPLPQPAADFLGAIAATGYLFPLIAGIKVLGGLALLSNRFVPFALVLLAPIVVNIAAFHLALTPDQPAMGILLPLLLAFLGWSYRRAYRPLFIARHQPEISASAHARPESSPSFRVGHEA